MPYIIKPYKNGFRVYNRITNKAYSQHPLSLQNAYKQMYILNHTMHGGDLLNLTPQGFNDAANYLPGITKTINEAELPIAFVDSIANKIFGGPKTLSSALAAEQGIDLFEDQLMFPQTNKTIIQQGVTPQDQVIYSDIARSGRGQYLNVLKKPLYQKYIQRVGLPHINYVMNVLRLMHGH